MSVSTVPSVDKGRRRRALDDEGEDEEALHSVVATRPSECESEGEAPDIELSEYESAVDEGAEQEEESEEASESETDEGSETESESGSETETEGGEGYSEDEGLEEERQSGDGEEQPHSDKPDDDEDKKNPAYVPRKGAFYEHDLRQGEEGPEAEPTVEEKPKKKLWQDEGKWSHDRYSDDSQAPKSREELIAIYGYDIRASDKPPEAPPRRPGRDKGPRKQQIKDFMPTMAVIDTTEDGTDSVPNLGDDGIVLYGGPSTRSTRRNNMRNSDIRKGGRPGNNDSVGYKKNQFDNRNTDIINKQENIKNEETSSKDAVKSEEFPSLNETVSPMNKKTDQTKKQPDRFKSDFRPPYEKISKPEFSDSNHQNDYKDIRGNKFHQSQDIRRDNRYQQGFRDDRRGGFNGRTPIRDRDNYNRSQEENWRSPMNEPKEGYRSDGLNLGKQDFNRKPQHKGDMRNARVNNSGEGRGYSNTIGRCNRHEQPPRYQQQHLQGDASSAKESREHTNTSYRSSEDKSKQRSSSNISNVANIVSDSGDGSTSQNVVFSNKENVQTINVTITSTTTEKKSYAKERRAKGSSRSMEGSPMAGNQDSQKGNLGSNLQYPGLPPGAAKMEPNSASQSSAKRYSSQRQQGLGGKGVYEPPPIEKPNANLYNPVSTTVLPLPPNASGIANPALFQPTSGPPPVLAPSYLPTGIMYAGTPRVPPPGTPAGFPISLAYASPPPPPTAVAAAVVSSQPPSQGNVTQPGLQPGAQHKKVYRGDITYYAPELQQPSRTHQKRPKAAIPIIDPQAFITNVSVDSQSKGIVTTKKGTYYAVSRPKQKSDHRTTPEKSTVLTNKSLTTSPSNSTLGMQSPNEIDSAQKTTTQSTKEVDPHIVTQSEQQLSQVNLENVYSVESQPLELEHVKGTDDTESNEAEFAIDTIYKNDSNLVIDSGHSEFLSKSIDKDNQDTKQSMPHPQSFNVEAEIGGSLTKNVEDLTLIEKEQVDSETNTCSSLLVNAVQTADL
ncbi:hypothetical protein Btru_006555 [Bulinus truncatus]|nr:hypothetical protein Btru_006555 [Bulinus truncatus]